MNIREMKEYRGFYNKKLSETDEFLEYLEVLMIRLIQKGL